MGASVSLRINYFLEDTALFGGVKVVLHHAELLRRRGHRVTIVSKGPAPSWYPVTGDFVRLPDFASTGVPAADLQIATFWTTVDAAAAQPTGCAVHFCQGFEGALEHNVDEHPAIERAYRRNLPTWTVSEHLAELNRERFGRRVRVVPPALEPWWYAARRDLPSSPPRVLVAHPFEFYMKGVDVALAAVRRLRDQGVDLELVRLSQWPLSAEERALVEPDEFHHHLPPQAVGDLLRGCDLLLAPSWPCEGFGLSVLEAMGCGVPVIASRIPSHEGFAGDAAVLVDGRDPEAFAAAAADVLADPARWRELRRAGAAAAAQFSEDVVGAALDEAVDWTISGCRAAGR